MSRWPTWFIPCVSFAVLAGCADDPGASEEDDLKGGSALAFRATCETSIEFDGDEVPVRSRISVKPGSVKIGVVQPEHPDAVDENEYKAAAPRTLTLSTMINYESATSDDRSTAGMLVLRNEDKKQIASNARGLEFPIAQSTSTVMPFETAERIKNDQLLWSCTIPDCKTFSARFDECLGEHAEGCFDIFEGEILGCCDGAQGQPAACADIEEHLGGG